MPLVLYLNVCHSNEGCEFPLFNAFVDRKWLSIRTNSCCGISVAEFHYIFRSGFSRIEICFSEHIDYFYERPDGCKYMLMTEICVYIQQQKNCFESPF